MRSVLAVALCALAGTQAFVAPIARPRAEVKMAASNDFGKAAAKAAFVALPFLGGVIGPMVAGAKIDYEGVGYLGGGDKVDLNNANVRAYVKYPGLYPTIAGKIVSHGPYKNVGDVFSASGLTEEEKSILKKYESKLVTLDPQPEYVIDRINNGLYR